MDVVLFFFEADLSFGGRLRDTFRHDAAVAHRCPCGAFARIRRSRPRPQSADRSLRPVANAAVWRGGRIERSGLVLRTPAPRGEAGRSPPNAHNDRSQRGKFGFPSKLRILPSVIAAQYERWSNRPSLAGPLAHQGTGGRRRRATARPERPVPGSEPGRPGRGLPVAREIDAGRDLGRAGLPAGRMPRTPAPRGTPAGSSRLRHTARTANNSTSYTSIRRSWPSGPAWRCARFRGPRATTDSGHRAQRLVESRAR